MRRGRRALLALLLVPAFAVADDAVVFLRAPWSPSAPPCPAIAPCQITLGGAGREAAAQLEELLDPRALAARARRAEDAAPWTALAGALAWRGPDLVALAAAPRASDASMGVEGLNTRVADELRLLASKGREALPPEASLILSPEGPILKRVDLLSIPEEELERILLGLDTRCLAVAAAEGSATRFERGGRVLMLGSEVVRLDPDGAISRLEPGGYAVLRSSDVATEAALLEGRIVAKQPLTEGITRPWRLTLEHEGQRLDAIFKTVEKRYAGRSKEGSFATEPYFIDSYRFERAAYVLDRALGLGLVPVTVTREVEGSEGSLTLFVEDAVQYAAWEESHASSRPSERLERQIETMRLLDALILNTDRNAFNLLVGTEDLSLHAIDHSRSFRFATALEPSIKARPPRAPDSVYARLEAIDASSLHEALDPLVGRQRVNALLARRDKLIDAKRAEEERAERP